MTRHERDGDKRYTPTDEAKKVKNSYRRKWRESDLKRSRRNAMQRLRRAKENG